MIKKLTTYQMQSRLNKESKAFVKKKKCKVLNTLKEKRLRQDQIKKKVSK